MFVDIKDIIVKPKSFDIRIFRRKMRSNPEMEGINDVWCIYDSLRYTRARILSLFIADKHFAHTLRSRADLCFLSSVYFYLCLSNEASLIKHLYFSKFIVSFLKYAHI